MRLSRKLEETQKEMDKLLENFRKIASEQPHSVEASILDILKNKSKNVKCIACKRPLVSNEDDFV